MPFLFWFDPFFEARAKIQKYFPLLCGSNKTLKCAFEIYWPLKRRKKVYILKSWPFVYCILCSLAATSLNIRQIKSATVYLTSCCWHPYTKRCDVAWNCEKENLSKVYSFLKQCFVQSSINASWWFSWCYLKVAKVSLKIS